MLLTPIDRAAFALIDALGASLDVRTDEGELILHPMIEERLKTLEWVVKAKQERISVKSRSVGRPKLLLPIDELRRRIKDGEKPASLAKEFKVDRITILRRVRENG